MGYDNAAARNNDNDNERISRLFDTQSRYADNPRQHYAVVLSSLSIVRRSYQPVRSLPAE